MDTIDVDLPSPSEQPEKEALCLYVVAGPDAGRCHPLGSAVVIGRGGLATFVLDDEGVSEEHARIGIRRDGRFTIEDLGSLNGTWINGERIVSHRETAPADAPSRSATRQRAAGSTRLLDVGDRIRIGATTFLLAGLGLGDELASGMSMDEVVQTEKLTTLGVLAAEITHELAQPVNSFKMILQDVLRDAERGRLEPEELKRSLEEAIAEADRMGSIIGQLRGFSRQTVGTQRRPLDINAPIMNVLGLLEQQLLTCDIVLRTKLGPALHVLGDPIRLEQVFMNLIVNARDALQANIDGPSIISVTTRFEPDAERRAGNVIIELSDNGSGVPDDVQERMFDSFFTTKERGLGTGLGLSVIKTIVEQHDGRIEVQSTEGVGTTFTVTLPRCADSGEAQ